MMRIRKKFALLICTVVIFVFLFLYFLINRAVPAEKNNLSYIENKLKQLENGLNHHQAEVGEIKKQINTIQTHQHAQQQPLQQPKSSLDNKEMIKESVIKAIDLPFKPNFQEKCSLKLDLGVKPDIQMLEIYKELTFDNHDGGVWKQGWRIEYDAHEWNSHHKLKVFVVPHSHNDPGWLNTFEEYYERSTKQILSNMLRHLNQHDKMTFIWAEISYFSKWYERLSSGDKKTVKKIINRKQLEIVTGGWVMSDEANSHWLSILQQLTEGNTWLKIHLNITPSSSWSIDPFGQSPTMPYILKNSGLKDLLIQRTHYSVKKKLAQEKKLEFRWRQLWDSNGDTEMFTHMMPFYSYDVPHTCGPNPKVCCQFDFKRLAGYGVNCPWKVPPQEIDEFNVAKKAELIVDQWRKKSVLYKTRSVLIPLGDDFRYSQSIEWDAQRSNYEKLFDYINNEPNLNTEAKFGTLKEYFDSVHKEMALSEFPSLSGDFFTYADRDDHYWSGYYTTRPFHKRMDRVLMNFLRSAEMLHAWNSWEPESEFDKLLENARRALSLFQHHDGITGTARDHVVKDYTDRMTEAIKQCKFIIQQAAYRLLTNPRIYQPDYQYTYFNIDDSRYPGPEESRPTIILGQEIPFKYVVIHNSLPFYRDELVEFYVSKPYIMVTEFDKTTVESQISPVWSWHNNLFNSISPQASTTKYKLIFRARVPPLGLTVYIIKSTTSIEDSIGTSFAKITILTKIPFSINSGDYPHQIEFAVPRDVSITTNTNTGASFNSHGLLKSISIDPIAGNFPIHLEFLKYGARKTPETSGAYLFLPDGPATLLNVGSPTVLVSKGKFESSVSSGLLFALHETLLRENTAIEIRNLVDIGDMANTEIIMRLSTGINNGDIFYTDLNGFQIIKRQRFSKIPLQANYYPIPTAIYIQDDTTRLTLLTAQPLGGSSLKSGEIEIMQDRRLNQDDNRGLGQGILDNQPTLQIFKLILENRDFCTKLDTNNPAGYLTVHTHNELQTLLHPFEKLVYHENHWEGILPNFGLNHEPIEKGIEVAVLRNLPHLRKSQKDKPCLGLVLHRKHFEECSTEDINLEGNVNLRKLLGFDENKEFFSSFLLLLKKESLLSSDEINLCLNPMDIKAYIIE